MSPTLRLAAAVGTVPTAPVYGGDNRGVIRIEPFSPHSLGFFMVHNVLDARAAAEVPRAKRLSPTHVCTQIGTQTRQAFANVRQCSLRSQTGISLGEYGFSAQQRTYLTGVKWSQVQILSARPRDNRSDQWISGKAWIIAKIISVPLGCVRQ
jgi:hypothetical protein